jgi:hypothetical protein
MTTDAGPDAGRVVQHRRSDGVHVLARLSGVLAGGLVALAIAVCVAQWLASMSGRPGPGVTAVIGHGVAALAAVALQLAAERSSRRSAALCSWSILLLVTGVLWFGWWA